VTSRVRRSHRLEGFQDKDPSDKSLGISRNESEVIPALQQKVVPANEIVIKGMQEPFLFLDTKN